MEGPRAKDGGLDATALKGGGRKHAGQKTADGELEDRGWKVQDRTEG